MTALVLAQALTRHLSLPLPKIEYSALAPILLLIAGALVLLTWVSLSRRRPAPLWALVTVAFGLAALVASWGLWEDVGDRGPVRAVAGALVVDRFAVFFMVLVSAVVVLAALLGEAYLRREGFRGPEFYVLVLLSSSGAMMMAAANDLVVLFLGLEILSIPLFVLAGFHARRRESREASMKYFVLGAFSSAIFLYGIALTYGATGSTNLDQISRYLSQNVAPSPGLQLAGLALLMVGLGFKVAAVPFHTWTPDVYQGAPTPVTGFMAATAKAAGFAGLLRVLYSTFSTVQVDWRPVVWVLAVLTLAVGSVVAIVQTDVKRMLAYSSISHAGYVLIGLEAASRDGMTGALFYLLAYTFMIIGSFAVVTLVGRRGDDRHDLDAYRGLAAKRPGLALAFTVFLMAQAGVPFTTGFLAKFLVISAAVESGAYELALIGMLAAAVAAFFYLRLVGLMYMTEPEGDEGQEAARVPLPGTAGAAVAVSVVVTLFFGLSPFMIDFARDAAAVL